MAVESELRAKIRALMASGVLRSSPPLVQRPAAESSVRMTVSNPLSEPCTICGEPGPQTSYFWAGGHVIRVHAACDAVWKQERERGNW